MSSGAMIRQAFIAGCVLTFASAVGCRAADAPAIAAASDLKFALPVLAKAFEAESGQSIKLTFGSSGVLATQIANGAPFEVFLSADEALVEDLNGRGLLRDAGQIYALGTLAVFAPEGSSVTCDPELAGLKDTLASGKVAKISIANPEHAPYGRAAKAAMETAGLWVDVQSHLLLGESATQALQFATDGGAAAALVPAPLVEAPEFPGKGCRARLSERLAKPLRQRLALVKTAGKTAVDFAAFITSEKGRSILAKYGFSFPSVP
jgi:molybdate transport system substrate-binding protein